MIRLAEIPITMTSDLSVLVTENRIDLNIFDGNLRLYFLA